MSYSRLCSVVSFVVVLKPRGTRFDPGLGNYVYRMMLANNLGSWCEDKHKCTTYVLIYLLYRYYNIVWNWTIVQIVLIKESLLRGIIGRNNFAIINFSLNFGETAINDNKVILEHLVAVHTIWNDSGFSEILAAPVQHMANNEMTCI